MSPSLELGYPWLPTDAGRASSTRPRQINDCTVRAVALVRRLDYDAAYDLLKAAGRSSGRPFHLGPWLDSQSWATKTSFPAIKGQPRMNVLTFVDRFPDGRHICQVAKHVFAVVDGVVLDVRANRATRCVYAAWAIA